ncbi:hypothetical protein ACJX0J_014691 [Zea mays]
MREDDQDRESDTKCNQPTQEGKEYEHSSPQSLPFDPVCNHRSIDGYYNAATLLIFLSTKNIDRQDTCASEQTELIVYGNHLLNLTAPYLLTIIQGKKRAISIRTI